MVLASVLNVADLVAGDETAAETSARSSVWRSTSPRSAILLLAYREFWAKVRRGALFKAAAVLVAGMADRHPARLGSARDVPRHAGTAITGCCYAVNRVSGFADRRSRPVRRPAARPAQRALRPVRRAGADRGGDRAVPVAARRERADRRGRVGDPRAAGAVRQERLAGLLRHPPRQVGGVRAQRPRRHHLPRRGRRLPGQRRPDRRSAGLAAGHRRLAGAVPELRLGARRDGRQFDGRPGLSRGRPQRAGARRRGDPATPTVPAVRPGHARGPPGGHPGPPGRADGADPPAPRHLRRRDGRGDHAAPTPGATPRPSAASRWRWAGSATRADGDCLLVEAVDGDDQVVAMLSLVPWGNHRRLAGPDAPLAAVPQRNHRTDGQRTRCRTPKTLASPVFR